MVAQTVHVILISAYASCSAYNTGNVCVWRAGWHVAVYRDIFFVERSSVIMHTDREVML